MEAKQVGTLIRHTYYDDFLCDQILGPFDVVFPNNTSLGVLQPGRQFELFYKGRWVKTCLGYNEQSGAFYCDRIGYINPIGMPVRI